MKKILLGIFLSLNLFAYEVGDTLKNTMAQHLNIDNSKLYVIDFYASWCGSCKKELPLISQANIQIDTNKVEFLGINVDKDIQASMEFNKETEINFRVINDSNSIIVSQFNPIGIPTLYYVKNKKIMKIITGALDNIDKQILNDIKEME
ncbi:redoxin domain-containing protein [Sulfurimonas sp. SAG-AH-194-I05]|nr:TlpA family protein disulfide reductase [Sulfurimonas sp. SAG-AH-194-I05]MDF1875949.1 redoxin domain-containing protein [Sulfurimonas sp. SAG-AH-194-I05]